MEIKDFVEVIASPLTSPPFTLNHEECGVLFDACFKRISGWHVPPKSDDQFGAETAEAVAKFQKAKVGAMYVDTVIGLRTGKTLLQNNEDCPIV